MVTADGGARLPLDGGAWLNLPCSAAASELHACPGGEGGLSEAPFTLPGDDIASEQLPAQPEGTFQAMPFMAWILLRRG